VSMPVGSMACWRGGWSGGGAVRGASTTPTQQAPGSGRALAGATPFCYNRLAVLLITLSSSLRTSSGSGVKSSPGLMKRSSSKPACFS